MAKLRYKLTGVEEVDRILRALPVRIANKLAQNGYKEAAKHVLGEAITRVPVDSGVLKKSLKIRAIKSRKLKAGAKVVSAKKRKKKNKKIPVPLVAAATAPAPTSKQSADPAKNPDGYYSHMVEFGTKKQAPQPFLIPALESAKEKVNGTLDSYVKTEVAKAQAGDAST